MQYSFRIDPTTGERHLAVPIKGKQLLLDPLLNKRTAFTARERDELELHGLLPPATGTIKQQLERCHENLQAQPTDINKFIYLTALHDRNEVLFYRLVYEHIDEMMPIVYTPVVGDACQKFSHIYRRAVTLQRSTPSRMPHGLSPSRTSECHTHGLCTQGAGRRIDQASKTTCE